MVNHGCEVVKARTIDDLNTIHMHQRMRSRERGYNFVPSNGSTAIQCEAVIFGIP